MRILIISYAYAPLIYPRAFRWSALAEYWTKQGYDIDIVCAYIPNQPRYEILNGVRVHRVGSAIAELLKKRFGKVDTDLIEGKKSTASASFVKQGWLTIFSKLIYDRTVKKIYWPDYAWMWYIPALKKAQQLMQMQEYDSLISVSHPFTGHAVGFSLKKICPKIRWIVDTGDPFCFLEETPANNQSLYKKLNYSFERKVFSLCEAISVTTENTQSRYADIFPESAHKIHVIPPLLDFRESPADENPFFSDAPKLRILYLGSLYKSIRSPASLLDIFSKLLNTQLADKLELHFVGSIYDCQEFFEPYSTLLDSKIFLHGKLMRAKALQAMKEADCLVNIGNDTPYQLPSKLVEYVSAGKPILNIAKIANDSSSDFLKDYPAALTLLCDSEKLDCTNLDKLIEFIEKLPQANRPDGTQDFSAKFRPESIARAYESLLG